MMWFRIRRKSWIEISGDLAVQLDGADGGFAVGAMVMAHDLRDQAIILSISQICLGADISQIDTGVSE